jgi:hypothetical protein
MKSCINNVGNFYVTNDSLYNSKNRKKNKQKVYPCSFTSIARMWRVLLAALVGNALWVRSYFCGAPPNNAPQKVFLWRTWHGSPQK